MIRTKITVIFGTRPEAIKLCPLILELQGRPEFDLRVVLSGQHRELCREVLDYFGITPNGDFNIMSHGQGLFDITEKIFQKTRIELLANPTDLLLVHGDTSTAFAASLAAFYLGVRVGHIEAGLRSNDLFSPYPEEFNRRAIDSLSYCHFCPTQSSKEALIREKIPTERIFLTGNTIVDALKYTTSKIISKEKNPQRTTLLMTAHRRENQGKKMAGIFRAVRRACELNRNLYVIFPVHPSESVSALAREILIGGSALENIELTKPLPLPEFHRILLECDFILSDSGGVQEEAVSLKKTLLLARENTERPEGILSGYVIPVGTDESDVFEAILSFLSGELKPKTADDEKNPFGDGKASQKIADAIFSLFK